MKKLWVVLVLVAMAFLVSLACGEEKVVPERGPRQVHGEGMRGHFRGGRPEITPEMKEKFEERRAEMRKRFGERKEEDKKDREKPEHKMRGRRGPGKGRGFQGFRGPNRGRKFQGRKDYGRKCRCSIRSKGRSFRGYGPMRGDRGFRGHRGLREVVEASAEEIFTVKDNFLEKWK